MVADEALMVVMEGRLSTPGFDDEDGNSSRGTGERRETAGE
jgi:hypothetical protein